MNSSNPAVVRNPRRWPHRVAVGLVCATFPLIWVGGLVTTYEAGMAVPDWPSTYGYNLFLYPWSSWLGGPWDLMIEHGHRLLASAVGLITIVLVVVTWQFDERPWAKWLMVGCLALVIAQGVLGGLRVLFDATVLARMHGCIGPLFFVSTLVAAAVTSSWWRVGPVVERTAGTASFCRLVWLTVGLAYLQLVLGAHLRHISSTWPPGVFRAVVFAHLIGASLLTVHLVLLVCRVMQNGPLRHCHLIVRPVLMVAGLLLVQLLVGAATWRLKYQWPSWLPQSNSWRGFAVPAESMLQTVTVTAHVALGSLILGMLVLVGLRSSRILAGGAGFWSISSATRLEGVML